MLAGLDPAELERRLVSARRPDQGGDARRGERARASRPPVAPRARRRASSREATTATSSAARACPEQAARSWTRTGRPLGTPRRPLGFTPGQRRGIGVAAGKPLHVLRTEPAQNRVVVGAAMRLARTDIRATRPALLPRRSGGGEAPLPLARRLRPACEAEAGGFRLDLDEPAYGVAPGQTAVLYEDDAVVGAESSALDRPQLTMPAHGRDRPDHSARAPRSTASPTSCSAGSAVALNLTFEHLEDLQLGLDSLLAQQDGQEDVTLAHPRPRRRASRPRSALSRRRSQTRWSSAADGVGLRRILDTVSDEVELGERDGARGSRSPRT